MKMSSFKAFLLSAISISIAMAAAPASAQQTADVIRGRVIGPDSQPIANVHVTAISYFGGITKSKSTDKNGRYSITYPNGEGDYWLSFNAIGFTPQRFEIKRNSDEEVLIANLKLSNSQTLSTVTVTASGPRQAPLRSEGAVMENTGTDKSIGGTAVPPDMLGNLAAMAASYAGVQLIPGMDGNPDKFSIFGLDGSQNNSTLNGQQAGINTIPRDAAVSTQLRSGYDVAYGGFSGAQIATILNSGTNYLVRSGSGIFNAPQAQWNDRIGQASEYSNVSLSGRLSGPIAMDRDFYTFSFGYSHRQQNLATLLSSTPIVYQSAGISADSVARLRSILGNLGIPLSVNGVNSSSASDNASILGSVDWAPKSASSGQAINIAYNGAFNSSGPFSLSPSQTPASLAATKSASGNMQVRHANFFGDGILTESQFTVGGSTSNSNPYLDLPSGSVLVTSALSDGSVTARNLGFGGGSNASTNNSQSLSGRNVISWFSLDSKHRLKVVSELSATHSSSDRSFNQFGRFTYQSLADLAAAHPSSFSRSLNAIDQSGSQLIGAVAIGDAWRVKPDLQVQYGLRLDGNRFLGRPNENSAIANVFNVSNTNVPNKYYVSPRFGFSYNYGLAKQIAIPDGVASGPRAIIRGGLGMFQNMLGPELVSGAIANTGLPGSAQQLICAGAATPDADWNLLQASGASIPAQCRDGTTATVFANTSPNVTMFDKDYAQNKSLRGNVNWSGTVLDSRFTLTLNALYSYNFHQADALDLNFRPATQFTLANEAGRPVYVLPTSIDTLSGLVASRDARVSPLFNTVSVLESNLHSQSRQFSVSVQPFFLGYTPSFRWSITYAYLNVNRQYRGFSSTGGNPLIIQDGTDALPRHDVSYIFSYNLKNALTMSFSGKLTSGTRYTPTVAGDINGDGSRNDRAFVFDPARVSDATTSQALQNLLQHGSGSARDCLKSQLGTIAAHNSCVGPWSMPYTALSITINPQKVRLPARTSLQFTVSNPAGAVDMLLHGENKLHGWGQTPNIDQTLLFVRGYDRGLAGSESNTSRFKYDVNQRFGSTRTTQTLSRTPVVVSMKIGIDFAPTRDWQNLRQQIDRGRTRVGARMPEASVRTMSSQLFPNPMSRMLQVGEQLHLSRKQADSLATMSRRYTRIVDSLWTPAAKFLAALPKEYDHTEAQARFVAAREVAIGYLLTVAPGIKAMMTKGQMRVLSTSVSGMLEPRYLELVRKGLAGSEFSFF